LSCRKCARACGAKQIPKAKEVKAPHVHTILGNLMLEKVHAVVAVKMVKAPACYHQFWTFKRHDHPFQGQD